MKSLQQLLRDHEKRLGELTSPLYADSTSPEVRAILIDTCKSAIEQIKQDIKEEAEAD
jgi:spore coat protein CotF